MFTRLLTALGRTTPAQRWIGAALVAAAIIALAFALYANTRQIEPVEPVAEPAPVIVAPEPAPAAAPEPAAEPAAPRRPGQAGEPFVERFAGPQIDARWFVSDGWSNGSHTENDWRANRLGFTPDGLGFTLSRADQGGDKPFSSAEIGTRDSFRHGWFEFRARVPKAPGLVTGFFTYAQADAQGRSNEIDIEFVGRDTKRVELAYHLGKRARGQSVRLPFDAADGFHTYAIEWLPDRVKWYADGELIHQVVGGGAENLVRPQKIILQQWATVELSAWAGKLDPDGGPWRLDVACVAYAPEKPDAGICG